MSDEPQQIHDPIDAGLAIDMVMGKAPKMAMCRCGEPLVCTLEFRGAEFYCQVCKALYGWLGPNAADVTPDLKARQSELEAAYKAERAERAAGVQS